MIAGYVEARAKLPDGTSLVLQSADSLAAALEVAKAPHEKNANKWQACAQGADHSTNRRAQWYGLGDNAQPADVARTIAEGWPDGIARMRDALAQLGDVPAPQSVRRRRSWADAGDALDIHRAYAGRIDACWERCRRDSTRAPRVVWICAGISASWDTDAEALFWRGAAALALADMLTDAGYHVGMAAIREGRESYQSGAGLRQRVTIKEPDAPLNLNSLAATVCLAGFFRLVMFQMQDSAPLTTAKNRGHSAPYKPAAGEIAGLEACDSAETARAWIARQIAALEGAPTE